MFRRRSPSPVASSSIPEPQPRQPSGRGLPTALADAGWVLPRGLTEGTEPRWTLVGTVGSPLTTPVDPAGLVVADGWSLDWWIGADDRWHVPAREAAVRQQLVGDAPVTETLVRIPGGDAVHRAYGVRSPRDVGDEWIVVEVENRTPIPFAMALVLRPFLADAVGSADRITVEPTEGGRGVGMAHLVRVDGRPALVLPRRPSKLAAGNRADGDALVRVTSGQATDDLLIAECPDGLATLALVYPLAHTATLRVAIPVGDVGDGPLAMPRVLPDAAMVASGWEIHRRGPRFETPDQRVTEGVKRARTSVHLAHDGTVVRRDGHRAPELDPAATGVLLAAFDVLDRPDDVGAVLVRWPERTTDATVVSDTLVLSATAHHWLHHRHNSFLDWMLPEVAAAVERLGRAERKASMTADERWPSEQALRATAQMLDAAGQHEAVAPVLELADRLAGASVPNDGSVAAELGVARLGIAAGDADAMTSLLAVAAALPATGSASGPPLGPRALGHDLAASAALVLAARAALVTESAEGLVLLPTFPDGWYGAGVELHDAPTVHGRLSYAIRWHGKRPAILWELEPHDGPVRLSVPGLDLAWSTTELRGDALLNEVAPPEGLDLVREVAEHPDIDPVMRRPSETPVEFPADAARRWIVLVTDEPEAPDATTPTDAADGVEVHTVGEQLAQLQPAGTPTWAGPPDVEHRPRPEVGSDLPDLDLAGSVVAQGDMANLLKLAGLGDAEIAYAREHRHLELLAIEHLVIPEEARYDIDEMAHETGLTAAQIARLWRSLGFVEPRPGDRIFTDVDVDMLGTTERLLALGWIDDELTVQMARVIGSSAARVASAVIDSVDPAEPNPNRPDDSFAAAAPLLLPMLLQIMDYVWRRHAQAEARARMAREHAGADPDHRVVGFADLVGFTALSQQISAHELAGVVDRFEAIAYDTVNRLGGRVVKMIGDEVMFSVPDEASAVAIALSLSQIYRDDDELSDVRVGLAAGPVLQREADLYGPVVNRASRIVNIAFPGTVVCSDEIRESLADDDSVRWKSIGSRKLKDIGKVALHVARRAEADEPPAPSSRQKAERRRAERREAKVTELAAESSDASTEDAASEASSTAG